MLTHTRLVDLLSYNPGTGVLAWMKPRRGQPAPGTEAGAVKADGYRAIKVDGRFYKAHRLAWFYAHGAWPPDQIDHVNRDKTDNRLANLRLATNVQNHRNKGCYQSNRSGVAGVRPVANKFQAYITHLGRRIHLGKFDSLFDAVAARKSAENKLWN